MSESGSIPRGGGVFSYACVSACIFQIAQILCVPRNDIFAFFVKMLHFFWIFWPFFADFFKKMAMFFTYLVKAKKGILLLFENIELVCQVVETFTYSTAYYTLYPKILSLKSVYPSDRVHLTESRAHQARSDRSNITNGWVQFTHFQHCNVIIHW